MARTLRMPSEADLPPGALRAFAVDVFGLYREAHRPSLRQVSEAIRKNENLTGTASPETIRRMLLGLTVPTHWPTVEAVLIALCDIAGVDPNESSDYQQYAVSSRREDLERLWHQALDNPDLYYRQPEPDPWATGEPPF